MIRKRTGILMCFFLSVMSCTTDRGYDVAYKDSSANSAPVDIPDAGKPGIVTAGEWSDLDNWAFWSNLMTQRQSNNQGDDYTVMKDTWRVYTNRRVSVVVSDEAGNRLNEVKVDLKSGEQIVWTARTDNQGCAEAWVGLFDPTFQAGELSISLNGVKQDTPPTLTTWESPVTYTNHYVISSPAPEAIADILFIVDATGSMLDEIDFLKADLTNILQKVGEMNAGTTIRTGALFYRDLEDEYLTITSPFTENSGTTIDFISKQTASGGGDYPEAVHTALEVSLKEFSWSPSAKARLAFMLLDAPPHREVQGVLESIQESLTAYSAKGIKLIPVASSGVDKSTEFALRFYAMATGSTYVFITNDSGVGQMHIVPTVGEYKVELLNDLMVRLISKYLG